MDHAAFLAQLDGLAGPGTVVTDPDLMAGYLSDWRRMFTGEAVAVLRPRTSAEVSALIKACVAAGVAVVPQGGNTGLAGGATPMAGRPQVVLSLARMNAIRRIDTTGLTVEVEAGVILQTLRDAVAAEGRLFPVSLAAEGSATIGGIIATNAGGVNVLRYGMTRDLVLGLEVVLADGTIVNALRPLRKDNAAQHWKQLFIGSEGSLGIVTAAVLRLVPQPVHRSVALISVPDVATALTVFDRAQTVLGDALSAFELIAAPALDLVATHFPIKAPVGIDGWALLIEAGSTLPGLSDAAESLLETAFEAGWATDGVVATSEAQADALWALREHVTEAEARAGRSLKHDVSLPITGFPAFLDAFADALPGACAEARPNVFGHLGDGNLHVNVILPDGADGTAVMRLVHDLVVSFGGSISAEHGLGQYRVGEWQRLTPPTEQALVGRIKASLDPRNLMNPGKAVPFEQEEHR